MGTMGGGARRTRTAPRALVLADVGARAPNDGVEVQASVKVHCAHVRLPKRCARETPTCAQHCKHKTQDWGKGGKATPDVQTGKKRGRTAEASCGCHWRRMARSLRRALYAVPSLLLGVATCSCEAQPQPGRTCHNAPEWWDAPIEGSLRKELGASCWTSLCNGFAR